MSLLDDLRDLITPGGGDEDRITSEEIGARRSEVREEIERLEAELKALGSDEGRREALAEADSPEDVGRRKRLIRDKLEGLEDLSDELLGRQREAENRERRRELRSAVEGLPERAGEVEEALARLRAARSRFEEALSGAVQAHATLAQRDLAPDVELPEAQARRVERLAEEHLSGARTLDFLYPDEGGEGEEPERFVREDVQNRIRYFVGDWSGVDWRERVPPAPAGWTNDFSRAEGIAEQ